MAKAARAAVLLLLLTCSARAGYIPNGSNQPPKPSSPSTTLYLVDVPPPAGGYVSNEVSDDLAESALSLLNSVLALL